MEELVFIQHVMCGGISERRDANSSSSSVEALNLKSADKVFTEL
jgi:hypothetical protein